jgi:hypothetical protein
LSQQRRRSYSFGIDDCVKCSATPAEAENFGHMPAESRGRTFQLRPRRTDEERSTDRPKL